MATKTINAEMLSKMFLAGAGNIEAKKEFINELNKHLTDDFDAFRIEQLLKVRNVKKTNLQTDEEFDCVI